MSEQSYFAGKKVMVTGGSSGIGLAFATEAARLGAKPILVARRPEPLEEAKRRIEAEVRGAEVDTLSLDVADEDAVESVMGAYLEKGRVDHLVNNAGIAMPGRFVELDKDEFRKMMDVNYFGAVHMTRAVLPAMTARREGHILNVSSLAGVLAIYGYTAYSASKFALHGFSQALRAELWPHGVQVSVCFPPDTDTPQLAYENQFKPAETKAIAGTVKTLSPEVVAQSMIAGMARGRFEIYPDVASHMVALGQRLLPGITRWVCDTSQKRAQPA
ncbi:MAG: SDR family oxidoreductase [Myxococcales bacterium]|nr:SDR family oxidoreductase [Myxococcales bacterium]